MKNNENQQTLIISYLTMRKAIGILGMVALIAFGTSWMIKGKFILKD